MSTQDREYTERLVRLQEVPWKKVLHVQAPYRWNLQRLCPGFTLEIGCGIGRNLQHLQGHGVGVDHNEYSVRHARSLGLRAFTGAEFLESEYATGPGRFDSLLLSHLLEHLSTQGAEALIREYLPYLKSGGRVLCICPQERGYASDASHVEFFDFQKLEALLHSVGCEVERRYSFPFPRWMGKAFIYNEFVVVGQLREPVYSASAPMM
jgi:SAM-dependent methyltransferase